MCVLGVLFITAVPITKLFVFILCVYYCSTYYKAVLLLQVLLDLVPSTNRDPSACYTCRGVRLE